MILGVAGIDAHLDHGGGGQEVGHQAGLVIVGVLVIEAPLVQIGVEVGHHAAVTGGAVAHAVEPGLGVGVEDLQGGAFDSGLALPHQLVVAAGVLQEDHAALLTGLAQELSGDQALPGHGALVDAEVDLGIAVKDLLGVGLEHGLALVLLVQAVGHQHIGADAGDFHHVLDLPELGGLVIGGVAGGHHLDAAVHRLGGGTGDVQLLLLGEVGHLAGLAHGEDAGAALLHIPVAQLLDGLEVGFVVLGPGGDHNGPNAGIDGKCHEKSLLR